MLWEGKVLRQKGGGEKTIFKFLYLDAKVGWKIKKKKKKLPTQQIRGGGVNNPYPTKKGRKQGKKIH